MEPPTLYGSLRFGCIVGMAEEGLVERAKLFSRRHFGMSIGNEHACML